MALPYYGLRTDAAGFAGMPQRRISPRVKLHDRVPVGEVAVRRGEHVHATDGHIGRVKGLVIDPADHHVTHFLLDEGHLWGQKTVAIPIGAVTHIEDGVRLNLTKDQVRDCRRSPSTSEPPPPDIRRPAMRIARVLLPGSPRSTWSGRVRHSGACRQRTRFVASAPPLGPASNSRSGSRIDCTRGIPPLLPFLPERLRGGAHARRRFEQREVRLPAWLRLAFDDRGVPV